MSLNALPSQGQKPSTWTASRGVLRSIACLAVTGVLLSPLASAQDRTSAITEERYAAISFALTMDLVTASLGSTCAKASEALSARAQTARSTWTTHNGQFVGSAHKYLLFVRSQIASERGDEAGSAFYEAQRSRFVADATEAMTDTFPGGNIDAAGCDKVLSNMSGGAMNLDAKPELFRSLVEIDSAITQMTEK